MPSAASALERPVQYLKGIGPKRAQPDDGVLFRNWNGRKIGMSRLRELMRKNVKLAGIEKQVTAIGRRDSLASALLENGLSIRYIQKILGHSRVSSTEAYSKATLTGLRFNHTKHFMKARRRGASKKA